MRTSTSMAHFRFAVAGPIPSLTGFSGRPIRKPRIGEGSGSALSRILRETPIARAGSCSARGSAAEVSVGGAELRVARGERLGDRARDQAVDLAVEAGQLLDPARREERVLRAGHHEDRLDVRGL